MREPQIETAEATPTSPAKENRSRRRSDNPERRQIARRAVDRQAIEARAYEFYLERGSSHGEDISDWLRAEQELAAG